MAILPEKGWSRNREPFKTLENKKKKKMLQGTSAYCVLLRMKQVTYKGSTVIPTSSSLKMIQMFQVLWAFLPENHDQSVEVSAEINGSLIFGILGVFSGVKSST